MPRRKPEPPEPLVYRGTVRTHLYARCPGLQTDHWNRGRPKSLEPIPIDDEPDPDHPGVCGWCRRVYEARVTAQVVADDVEGGQVWRAADGGPRRLLVLFVARFQDPEERDFAICRSWYEPAIPELRRRVEVGLRRFRGSDCREKECFRLDLGAKIPDDENGPWDVLGYSRRYSNGQILYPGKSDT